MKTLIFALLTLASLSAFGQDANGWTVETIIDKLTGEARAVEALSPVTTPEEEMDSPYADIASHIQISCLEFGPPLVLFAFTSLPILELGSPYGESGDMQTYPARAIFGDYVEHVKLIGVGASEALSMGSYVSSFDGWYSETLRLLILTDQGPVIFEYSLKGHKAAYNEMAATCAFED